MILLLPSGWQLRPQTEDKQELPASSSQEDWLPPAHPPKGHHVGLSTTAQASAAGEGPVQKACPMSVPRHILLLSVLLLQLLSCFSRVRLFATPWTVARQAPLSMAFSRQEYWSGVPCPPPGELPDPGIEPESPMSPARAGGLFTTRTTWEVCGCY